MLPNSEIQIKVPNVVVSTISDLIWRDLNISEIYLTGHLMLIDKSFQVKQWMYDRVTYAFITIILEYK